MVVLAVVLYKWFLKQTLVCKATTSAFMHKGVRLLPVQRQGRLVGILTRSDVKKITGGKGPELCPGLVALSDLKAADIMTKDPITIPADYTIEEAAEVMVQRHIPGCPVLDCDGRVVGVITKADILRALVSSPGLTQIGVVFGIQAYEGENCVANVMGAIRKYGAQLMAVWSSYANAPEGYRNIYVRIVHRDPSVMKDLERDLSQTCKLLFVVDRKNDRREIFEPGTAVP